MRWRFQLRLQLQSPRRSQFQRRLQRRLQLYCQPQHRCSQARALRHTRPGRTAGLFVLEGDHVLDTTHTHRRRQQHGLDPADDGDFDREINTISRWLCGQRSSASPRRQLQTSTPGADSEHQLQSPVPERTPHRGFGASFGGVLCTSCC